MFCSNCGNQIPENAKFCNHCGASQADISGQAPQPQPTPQANTSGQAPQPMPQAYVPQQPAANPERKTGLMTGGIILLVLGVISVMGACSNGTYQYMRYRFDLSDLVVILMQIGFIVGGIVMINKSKGKK